MRLLLLLLITCGVALCAFAQINHPDFNIGRSGNDFLRVCEKGPADIVSGLCVGYVWGVTDGVDLVRVSREFCPGPEVTIGQRLHIVLKFINDHPETSDARTDLLILAAMNDAFPCLAGKQGQKLR